MSLGVSLRSASLRTSVAAKNPSVPWRSGERRMYGPAATSAGGSLESASRQMSATGTTAKSA